MKNPHDMGSQIDPTTALDRTIEVAARLTEVMQGQLERHGLNVAQASVLFHLRHQGPMVQRQLSEAIDHSPRHVTSLVDALEHAGLVQRSTHPDDRRAWLVRLTDRGAALSEGMEQGRQEAAELLFADPPAADVEAYVAMLDHVLEQLASVAAEVGSEW